MKFVVTRYFVVLVLLFTSHYSFAQNKVVVVPLGGDEPKMGGEVSISIPVTSLIQSSGANLDFTSPMQARLYRSGNTSFGTTFLVPMDHKPGTLIYVDIYIYNPLVNGACQAVIRTNYGRAWKPGEPRDQSNVFGYGTAFPSFTQGEQTYVHTYRFKAGIGAGHSVGFGMFRSGDNASDNCGELGLVGMQIRYERE
ncbi:hypothetical protein GCM10008090_22700 [Arenicella chitinivorans]|uniref:Uncharacterized protein n=1 Tax=Arenicella chitinivorans TaxID=1329800 RepID=A0A918VND2_9GAMM|nr:hypothetical protein [Arenicella chitinivorans]GHA12274.1 hypothetical protein GCM10008090_22700 [Arenicella chitinivorans]